MLKLEVTNIVLVSDLIDTENRSWRRDLVREVFIAPNAEAILNIPLRRGGGEDFGMDTREVNRLHCEISIPCSSDSERETTSR